MLPGQAHRDPVAQEAVALQQQTAVALVIMLLVLIQVRAAVAAMVIQHVAAMEHLG